MAASPPASARGANEESESVCGIAGIVNVEGGGVSSEILQRMNDRMRHRGPDDEGLLVDGCAGLSQRRLVDHRSLVRPSADDHRGRHDLGHLQRRDLQLPGTAPAARRPRPSLPHQQRHRIDLHGYRQWGVDCVQPLPRHVRLRAVGRARENAVAGARPRRQKAAVLRSGRRPVHLRLGNAGDPRASRHQQGNRPRGARPFPDLRIHSRPKNDSQEGAEAAGRALADARRQPRRRIRRRRRASSATGGWKARPKPIWTKNRPPRDCSKCCARPCVCA